MEAVREVCVIERKSYSKEDLKEFEIVLGFDPAADGKIEELYCGSWATARL